MPLHAVLKHSQHPFQNSGGALHLQLTELLGGENNVAEMTGRKGGLQRDANGVVKWEIRNSAVRSFLRCLPTRLPVTHSACTLCWSLRPAAGACANLSVGFSHLHLSKVRMTNTICNARWHGRT